MKEVDPLDVEPGPEARAAMYRAFGVEMPPPPEPLRPKPKRREKVHAEVVNEMAEEVVQIFSPSYLAPMKDGSRVVAIIDGQIIVDETTQTSWAWENPAKKEVT